MTLCEEKSGGNILCLRLSGLGDIVHALSALSRLRECRPHAHIAWVVEDRFSELLAGQPHIDELIVVPRTEWSQEFKNPFAWPEVAGDMRGLGHRLREGNFDTSIDFQSSIKSAWLVAAAGAEQRVGFGWNVARELSPLVNNTLVRTPDTECHRIERDLALLGPLGIPTRHAQPLLACNDRDERIIERRLEGRLSGGPVVIMHPGTSDFAAFKRWPPERYAMVADRLSRQHGADVLVSRGPGEEEIARRVYEYGDTVAEPAPETENLQQLIHLLSRADLFVGSDTGPLHVASALEVPCVALFGPKDPLQTGPYCSRSEVVTGRAGCRPCERRTCPDPRCMTSIGLNEVVAAASRVLGGGGQCRASRDVLRLGAYFGFSLGRWRGEVECSCSSPAFFSRLADLIRGQDEEQGQETSVTLPDGDMVGLSRDNGCGLGAFHRIRNGWRQSVYALRRGVSVPFRACCTWNDGRLSRRVVVASEEGSRGEGLAAWLRKGGSDGDRAVAAAVASLHGKSLYHGALRGWALCPSGENDELTFNEFGRGFRMDWMPRSVRLLLRVRDMATLLDYVKTELDGQRARRILDYYCVAAGDSAAAERIMRYLIPFVGKWGFNTRIDSISAREG